MKCKSETPPQARCPVHTYYRDGSMRFDGNGGGAVNYEPNSFDGPVEDSRFKEPALKISGDADRYDHREGNDDYTQAGNLFRLMPKAEQEHLMDNIARAMKGVPEEIVRRQIGHLPRLTRPMAAVSPGDSVLM